MKEEGSFNHLLIVIGCCSAGALRRIFILCHRNCLSLVCLSDVKKRFNYNSYFQLIFGDMVMESSSRNQLHNRDVRGGMKRRCWGWRWVEMWLAEGALIHSTPYMSFAAWMCTRTSCKRLSLASWPAWTNAVLSCRNQNDMAVSFCKNDSVLLQQLHRGWKLGLKLVCYQSLGVGASPVCLLCSFRVVGFPAQYSTT